MEKKIKKYLISIIITLLLTAAIFYVIPYHGTRVTEVYDIGSETEIGDVGTLQLQVNIPVEQHFVSNTYCLKGINYILLGINEGTDGEIAFSVETVEGKELVSKKVSYQNIEPGQWENVELPTHLKQGTAYVLRIVNLSKSAGPAILTADEQTISQVECGLIADGEEHTEQLLLGYGFRGEFTRTGKILVCLMACAIWCYIMYAVWFKKKAADADIHNDVAEDSRKYYYDFLRVAAIWMVIYNHTVLNGFMLFTQEQGTVIFWIEQFFSIFIVIAVPLFWMMSGALLLGKEENLKTLFKKRILRFFIVLILFSLLQYGYKYYTGKLDLATDGNYFKWVYQMSDGVPAYWYLYAYLGYLFMLPVLRRIATGLKREEFQYLFIVYTIYTGVLPVFEYFILGGQYHLRDDFQIPVLASSCITFVLLGYYVEHIKKEEEFTYGRWLLWLLASIVLISFTTCITKYRCEVNGKWSEVYAQYFFKCFTIIPTYMVFYGVKLWSMKHTVSSTVKRVGAVLGSATFGLMLIENVVREKLNFVFDFFVPHFGKFLGGMLWVTVIAGVGLGIAAVMKKIPLLKKLL